MNIKNSEIQVLYNTLTQLEPAGKPSFVFSGKVRYNIALNIKSLRIAMSDIENMRLKLVREKIKPGETELSGIEKAEFIQTFSDILDAETDVNIIVMKVSDLDLDKNQIPIEPLSVLIGTLFVE